MEIPNVINLCSKSCLQVARIAAEDTQ